MDYANLNAIFKDTTSGEKWRHAMIGYDGYDFITLSNGKLVSFKYSSEEIGARSTKAWDKLTEIYLEVQNLNSNLSKEEKLVFFGMLKNEYEKLWGDNGNSISPSVYFERVWEKYQLALCTMQYAIEAKPRNKVRI